MALYQTSSGVGHGSLNLILQSGAFAGWESDNYYEGPPGLYSKDNSGWGFYSGGGGNDGWYWLRRQDGNIGLRVDDKVYAQSSGGLNVTYGVATSTLSVTGAAGASVTYGIAVGSMTASSATLTGQFTAGTYQGGSLSTCGDSSHALSWSAGSFGCQSITGSGGSGGNLVNLGTQFQVPYYSFNGSSNTFSAYPAVTFSTTSGAGVTISTVVSLSQTGTGSVDALAITSTGTGRAIYIKENGQAGNNASSSGAFFLDNSNNSGIGMNIYTTHPAPIAGSAMLYIDVNSASYNRPAVRIDNIGTSAGDPSLVINSTGAADTLQINQQGTTGNGETVYMSTAASANAIALYGNNPNITGNMLVVQSSGTGNLVKLTANGFAGGSRKSWTGGLFNINMDSSTSNPDGLVIVSSEADSQAGKAMLRIWTKNANYNDPHLWIQKEAANSGPPIRIDANTQAKIEMYDTSKYVPGSSGYGAWATQSSGGQYTIANRDSGDTTFSHLIDIDPPYNNAGTWFGGADMVLQSTMALVFTNYAGNHAVGFAAPTSAMTTSTLFRLPIGDGSSGQFLKTDGSANLSWGTAAGGASALAVGTGTASAFTWQASSPTAIVNFSSSSFGAALTGSATAFITLNSTQTFTRIVWSDGTVQVSSPTAGGSGTTTQLGVIGVTFGPQDWTTSGSTKCVISVASGTITAWSTLSDSTAAISVGISTGTYSNFSSNGYSSIGDITGGNYLTLPGGTYANRNEAVSGWTSTTVNFHVPICFRVLSVTPYSSSYITAQIYYTKT